ncbi:MAG: HAMP domain-containing histidine kinase [Muribaculaceae bacterium]|nr:HAMP domain-containing histidine kinase [Muribaculaceae bacterium]
MEENHENKKPKTGKKIRGFLHLLQHCLVVIAAISILIITTGSTVVVQGLSGNESYSLHASDQEKTYEDSTLFNTLYGKAVADIIRFGVIRSQLETDGVFDGSKIIDITAYNYREQGVPEQYVTARYYLEDLLKWQKYGMEYSTVSMTAGQAKDFLADKTMVTIVDPNSKYYNTSDANYMKSDIGSYTFVDDVSANSVMLPIDEYNGWYDEEETLDVNVLINRYKTAEGKNIEEYTSDFTTYQGLCENLRAAMYSLSYNYSEYLDYQKYYDGQNTNIRYCIEKTVGEHTEYFTNIEGLIDDDESQERLKEDGMTSALQEKFQGGFHGKYLYYSPSEMIYESNSSIKESTVQSIVKEYDYAYPENIKIWIGVDSSYPVGDAFVQGKAGFQNYLPYFWQWVILAVTAVVFYFVLLIYLTGATGRDIDGEGNSCISLSKFDKMPTEAALFLGVFSAAVILIGAMEAYDMNWGNILHYEDIYTFWFKIGIGIAAFVMDIIFCFFYYSLIRRVKAKTLWSNSYLKRILQKCSDLLMELYDNGNIVVRTWVPYLIFLIFNCFVVVFGMALLYRAGNIIMFLLGIFIAFLIDMLIGAMLYKDVKERQNIVKGIEIITEGDFSYQIEQEKLHGDNLVLAKSVNSIGNGIKSAVEVSMKDERMKADLITNVSHDIKTPLTSIINYVDLIKREKVDNERVQSYIKVLDEKSQRLKQLTDDLVEASKISSGNINLHFEKINLTELLHQTIGEFSEKFEQKALTPVMDIKASHTLIEADSRSIWRVMENLFNNVYKYALEGTRVYITMKTLGDNQQKRETLEISIKNISAMALNCNPEELTERFIRGDESRTTEGSGLGLSIAKNLVEAQHGTFEIQLDGDLFKVVITFQTVEKG